MKNTFILLALLLLAACSESRERSTITAFTGGTLIIGNGEVIEDGTLIIRGDSILAVGGAVEIPEGAEVVEVNGKFVMPGLVDAHVHFGQTGFVDSRPDALDVRDSIGFDSLQARLQLDPDRYFMAYLGSGVTSVYDVGGYLWTLDMQQPSESNPESPRIAAAGPLLTPVPQEYLETFNTPAQQQLLELRSPDFGRRVVQQNTALGATGIKLWQLNLDNPDYMESLEAVAEESRKQGNQLIVHATTLRQAKEALEAGAKVLVHSVEDQAIDEEFVELALMNKTIYIPTMTVYRGYYNNYKAILDGEFDMQDPNGLVDPHTRKLLGQASGFADQVDTIALRQTTARMERRLPRGDSIMALNLKKAREGNLLIAAGTDAGNPGTLHGVSIYKELEAMQSAGIPAGELLVMTTRNGAIAMQREDDLGTLEEGKKADFLILDEDPRENISNLRGDKRIFKGGQEIEN